MKIDIPENAKKMTLPNGMDIDIPTGAKSMDVPDEYFKETKIETPKVQEIEEPKKESSFIDKAKDFGKEFVDNTTDTFIGYRPFGTKDSFQKAIAEQSKKQITKNLYTGENVLGINFNESSKNKVDEELISDLDSLARVDIRLIGDSSEEDKDKYLDNVSTVLGRAGYKLGKRGDEYVAIDNEGKVKEITNDLFDSILDSLGNDKFEISGAVVAGAKGLQVAKSIPNPFLKALVVLGYSAGGSVAGTTLDTTISTLKTEQKFDIEDFFNELGKSAVLDVAGNAGGYLVVKAAGKSITAPKKLWNHIKNNNMDGAREILKNDLKIDEKYIDEALESAKQDYKEVTEYSKGGITNFKQKQQEELLAAAQKNKKFGSDIIHDAVLDDVDVARNVATTIDNRSKNVLNLFNDIKVDGTDVKKSIKNYEDTVHAKYTDMRNTFKEAFSETGYRFDLKTLKFDKTLETLSKKITDPYTKDKFKNLQTTLENIVYDKELGIGVVKDIDDLLDIRQMMNKFYRENKRAFELKPDQESFFNLVKNIDSEIENSIKKYLPEDIHKPLIDSFDNARLEYKQMYDIADTKLYKSVMGDGMSADARMNNLIKHTKDDDNEFATLLQKLPKDEQEKIENSIVNTFLEKNLVGKDFELQVIDYKNISKEVEKMKDFFVTQSGKDAIELIEKMALKYGDDIDLIKAASQAGVDTNAGIATTIKGRIEYKIVKGSFDRIMRLIPFSKSAKRLALQQHIKEALQKSRTPMDLAKRVASSPDVPADELAKLKQDIKDFNKIQRSTRESQLKILEKERAEREAKELAKKEELNKEKIAQENDFTKKAEELTAKRPDLNTLKALDRLEGNGRGHFFENMNYTKEVTPRQVKEYERALAEYGDKVELKVNEINYPISVDNRAKIEELRDYLIYAKESGKDDIGFGNIINGNKYKALMDDLNKGEFRSVDYEKTYYDLMKAYDEFEPRIKAMYEDDSFTPFVKFADNLAVGTYAGVETDEDGNIIGFDPEKFVIAFGGYTAAKQMYKKGMFNSLPEEVNTIVEKYFGVRLLNNIVSDPIALKNLKRIEDSIKKNDIETLIITDKKGNELKRIGGNENQVQVDYSISEAIKNYEAGKIMTHNHPSASSFSWQDLTFALDKGIDEIRAIGHTEKGGDFLYELSGLNKLENSKETKNLISNTWDEIHNSKMDYFKPKALANDGANLSNVHIAHTHYTMEKLAKVYGLEYKRTRIKEGKELIPDIFQKNFIDKDGFYSVLEKTVDEKVGGKIDSVSLAKMLEKNGVKEDELEWSGLKELMESNEKLTKEEIEETIKNNRLAIEQYEQKGITSQYEQYTLKGGENYREILFKKPAKIDNNIKIIDGGDGYYYAELPPYDGTNVIKSGKHKNRLIHSLGEHYTSSHWDDSNILSTARVKDRSIDDKKTIFIEEIQSDWHQEGRKKGYKVDYKDAEEKYNNAKKEFNSYTKQLNKKYATSKNDWYVLDRATEEEKLKNEELRLKQLSTLNYFKESKNAVINAPFKKNWPEFTLKRLLQEAVEKDYDKIAWTTGKQQADRYSLEKTADEVVYNKSSKAIKVSNKGKEVFFKIVTSDEELEGIIGKEIAQKLMKSETKAENVFMLKDNELKFGGDGMKAFYDSIIPNYIKKLFKKYKVKPKIEELDDIEEMVWSIDIPEQMKEDIKKLGQPLYATGGVILSYEAMQGDNK
mgnify:CR=1 FL=1